MSPYRIPDDGRPVTPFYFFLDVTEEKAKLLRG